MDPKIKLGIALAVVIVALGTAGYLGYSSMGGGRTVRSASEAASAEDSRAERPGGGLEEDGEFTDSVQGGQRMEIEGEPPAWMQQNMERAQSYSNEYEFPDNESASANFDAGSVDLALRAESEEALNTVGIASRRSLIESWSAFMLPLLSGDAPAFERVVSDFGSPNPEAASTLFDRLATFLEGARVATDSARIRSVDPTQRGAVPLGMPQLPNMPAGVAAIPMMVGIMELEDDATGETTTIRDMNIPLAAIFPDATEAAKAGARTIEVWAPAKLRSAKGARADIGPSVFFAFDDENRVWQPVAMRLSMVSDAAASKLESMMQNRRRPGQD